MQTVVGVFDSPTNAELARHELVNAGFDESSIRTQSHAEEGGEGFMSSVGNFFRDLFGGEDQQSGQYAEAVRRGGSVLTVDVADDDEARAMTARQLMASGGAVNLGERTEQWREEGYDNFNPSAAPYKSDELKAERGRVLPVVREEIEIGKRELDLGAVRIVTRMENQPVSETLQLREQHAEIERHPVDRPATEEDLKAFEGGTIEVRETAERAVISKKARVVEEVSVGTQASTRNETVSDTVRNTVVEVEKNAGAGDMQDDSQQRAAQYRTHFDRNLASGGGRYEEYEPAYQYGSSMGTDSRYANRGWDDLESDAEQDWSRRNPGTTWERAKAAVRHGWESVSGDRSTGTAGSSRSSASMPNQRTTRRDR